MVIESVVGRADDALNVRRVFGEPVNKNGLTVIPAARVVGGGGGGTGPAAADDSDRAAMGTPSGSGAGFGLSAQPAGVFVLKGEEVRWVPAVDVNRMIFGMQIVAIFLFLTVRSIAKMRYQKAA